jgi:hypothetical protein
VSCATGERAAPIFLSDANIVSTLNSLHSARRIKRLLAAQPD